MENKEFLFNPHSEQYKKVEDLPEAEQGNFINTDNGFVKKEAANNEVFHEYKAKKHNKERSFLEKITGKDFQTAMNSLQEEAEKYNQFEITTEEKRILAEGNDHSGLIALKLERNEAGKKLLDNFRTYGGGNMPMRIMMARIAPLTNKFNELSERIDAIEK